MQRLFTAVHGGRLGEVWEHSVGDSQTLYVGENGGAVEPFPRVEDAVWEAVFSPRGGESPWAEEQAGVMDVRSRRA
ncbi:hypothetical protein EYF80_039794 [Liparis tanakae]|uniref:Uncharacterized protein n=1 Tax=Liparis tanakae TaxID=230148 RepID=A0A4Z2G8V1_9TELE|nr:hypothetical protein EYF80_039794 [Liparis tanakae]